MRIIQKPVLKSEMGFATYGDSVYTEGSPLVLTNNNEVTLVNNAANIVDFQKPLDIDSFMDGSTGLIKGRAGDAFQMNVLMKLKPQTNSGAIDIDVSLDIGIPSRLFPRGARINRGVGNEYNYLSSFFVYNGATWQANSAEVKAVVRNSTVEVYDIIYYFCMLHRSR